MLRRNKFISGDNCGALGLSLNTGFRVAAERIGNSSSRMDNGCTMHPEDSLNTKWKVERKTRRIWAAVVNSSIEKPSRQTHFHQSGVCTARTITTITCIVEHLYTTQSATDISQLRNSEVISITVYTSRVWGKRRHRKVVSLVTGAEPARDETVDFRSCAPIISFPLSSL